VQVSAIENTSGAAANGNTINISNNVISGCNQTINTTGTFYGILNSAPAKNIIITGNTFTNNFNSVTTGTTYLIYNAGQSKSLINLSFNNFSYALTSAHSGYLFGIYNSAGTASTIVNINNNLFSNYNCSVTSSSGKFHFLASSGTNSVISFNNNAWNSLTITTQGGLSLMLNTSNSQAGVSVKSNSIVSGFTIPGLAGDFLGYVSSGFSAAACNVTITGNNFSNINAAGYGNGSFMGITSNDISTAPYAHVKIYDNIISNIYYNGQGGVLGIYANYLGPGSSVSPSSIHNNTITNIDTWGTCTGLNINPNNSSVFRTTCYNNLISNMLAREDGGLIYGAYIQCQNSGLDFYSNKILNIVQSGTITSRAIGIEALNGKDVRIFNNIIGLILGSNATLNDADGNDASTGISIGDGPDFKIYFNTVYLTGISLGSSCINTTNTTTYTDIKNNIFVNLCTPSGTSSVYCMRRYNTMLSGYEPTSNNNLFYAGTPGPNNIILQMGNSNYTTLSTMKASLAGRELNSVTENPNFISILSSNANFLKPNTTTPTQIESGAAPIGSISADFYFTTRNLNFPDIGAIEGIYTSTGVDMNSPTIANQGFSSPPCNISSRTFTVNISDISGVATGSLAPRVYYKINNGSYVSTNGSLTAGTTTMGVWSFNLSFTASINDIISYYLVAQDNAASPNLVAYPSSGFLGINVNTIVTSPTTPLTYTIYNTLGGTYTVGALGTFTTLTAAANAYNVSCLSGPVTFVLSDALYSVLETFPITFLNNTDASITNSLLIKPATGVSASIKGMNNTGQFATIKFLDANYITFDGLNTSGSQLKVINTATFNFSNAGVWLASGGNGNKNISLSNITFSALSSDYSYGILATEDGSLIPLNQFSTFGGLDNDYIKIKNNTFLRQAYGIAIYGASVSISGGSDNWLIDNNRIGPTSPSINNIQYTGIQLSNVLQSAITNNTISNIYNNNDSPIGINTLLGVSNFTIEGNTIKSIKYTSTLAYSGVAICLNTGFNFSNITVSNNMICDLMGNASPIFTSGGLAGITVGLYNTTGGVNFYNNSIAINQATASPGYTDNCVSSAIYFSPLCDNIDLRNNILYSNVQLTTYTNSTSYAIYSDAPASAFNVMDYNSFIASGPQGVLGYLGGQLTSLGAIKNAFNQNNHSISMLPVFTASTNLHIDLTNAGNYFFNNLGSVVTAVTVDIDHQSRNLTSPDIGADEYSPVITCTNASGGSVISTSSVCAGTSLTLNASGVSGGVSTAYQWQVSPTSGGSYTNVSIGSNANTPAYSLGAYPPGVYYFILKTSCTSLSLAGISNEATVSVISPPNLIATASQSIVCSGNPVTMIASGASTYTWSDGYIGSLNTLTPTSSGIYNVTGVIAPCTAIQSADILVYFSTSPTVAVSSTSTSICVGNSVTISALGANSYSWSNGSLIPSITDTPLITTTYSVIGSSSGCTNQATKTIIVNALPLVAINGNTNVCLGNAVTLLGNGANTYTWSNASTSNNIIVSPLTNTTFSVIGKDANDCINTASTTMSILTLPLIMAQANTTIICTGDPVILNGSGGLSYSWSNGVLNNIAFNPTNSGIYTVIGIGSNSCQASANIFIMVNQLPNTNITTTASSICVGESVTLAASGALFYLWSTTSTSQSITVAPILTSFYTVIGTDINGCSKSFSYTIILNACTGLSQLTSNNKHITIYPSPNTGKFYVQNDFYIENNSVIEITNELGQLLYTSRMDSALFLVDITENANGIYFINIVSKENSVRKKIIKQ
jgi:trimeric autotransporter adhesin